MSSLEEAIEDLIQSTSALARQAVAEDAPVVESIVRAQSTTDYVHAYHEMCDSEPQS